MMKMDIHNSHLTMRRQALRMVLGVLCGGSFMVHAGCRSNSMLTQDGVRFEIDDKLRWHRVENDGETFSYDSPELSVTVSKGRMVVNSEPCGSVQPGDLVQITDLGTVLVNGERRGDKQTGREKLEQRLKVAEEALARQASTEEPAAR